MVKSNEDDVLEARAVKSEELSPDGLVAALLLGMNGFIDQKTVEALTTLSHSEIHRRQQTGTFPMKEPIGKGARKGYRARVIQDWLDNPEAWKK